MFQKKYKDADPELHNKKRRVRYFNNAESYRTMYRNNYALNKDKHSARRKLKRQLSDQDRTTERRRTAERRLNDVSFRLIKALRARIGSAIKRNTKTGSAITDLGCSIDQLKNYLSAKFTDEMSWDNWPIVWNIDHIKPLCSFNLNNPIEYKEAVHYTNLQPLLINEHRTKSSKERWRNV